MATPHAAHGTAARPGRFARGVAATAGGLFVILGVWAFLAPRSFFDTLAVFPPYNAHFLHDIGGFQIGLGAVLLFALVFADSLRATLWGVAAGNFVHLVSHIMDTDLGGNPATDIGFFALLTVVLVAAALDRGRAAGA